MINVKVHYSVDKKTGKLTVLCNEWDDEQEIFRKTKELYTQLHEKKSFFNRKPVFKQESYKIVERIPLYHHE